MALPAMLALALVQTGCGSESGGPDRNMATVDNGMENMAGMEPAEENMATENMAATAAVPAPNTTDYVTNAALGDMYEIESSKIAKTKAQSADLKSFANKMITDHTATTKTLKAALPEAGVTVTPPTSLDGRRAALIDQLNAAAPTGFDEIYRQQQLAAHQEALQLHESYAQGGDNAALAKIAGEVAPKVQQHLDMLEAMKP